MRERERWRKAERESEREREREVETGDLDWNYYLFGLESGGPKALCFIRVLITLRVTVPQRTFPSRSSTR